MHLPVPPPLAPVARRRAAAVVAVVSVAAGLTAAAAPAARAASAPAEPRVVFSQRLRFAELPMRTAGTPTGTSTGTAAAATPLRTFSSSFTFGGRTFPYTMVGSPPGGAATTTTVASTITPLTFRFGTVTMSSPAVNTTTVLGSGLFTDQAFPGGTGQYGDVFLRTQFWSRIGAGSKAWHVRLARPAVRPTLTLTVPATSGRSVLLSTGVRIGVVDIGFLDAQLRGYVSAPAPDVLTQLLATNIVLCRGNPTATLGNCGIGGYHSAWSTPTGRHTFTYQGYLSPLVFDDPTSADLAIMSHQLGEWLADPYATNPAPAWRTPGGCNRLLEVGDGLVGTGVRIGGLFYQDLAYLPYFAHQTPSPSWLGRYSWFGTSKAPSTLC